MSQVVSSRSHWWPERPEGVSLAVGVIALILCVIGAFFTPVQFFQAYLASYHFFLGLGLGCLVVLMMLHLTWGGWAYVIRRILEAGTRTLPLMVLLFLPIAFGLRFLFPWSQATVSAAGATTTFKGFYLNVPFFLVRAAIYFALWLGLAYYLDRWSRCQDRDGDPRLLLWFSRLGGLGLVAYGIAIHFASIDWLMSLHREFRSTIFGPLLAARHMVSGTALVALSLAWLARRPPLDEVVSESVLHDVGNLLLTFLIVWAYLFYFQYMLIWIADLPYEVAWFLPRINGVWGWIALGLVLFGFVVPFLLLLSRDLKRDPVGLAWIGGLVLFTQLVFSYYEVSPLFPGTSFADHWMNFVMPIGIGGIWLACFLWQLPQRPPLPANDPNRALALEHRHRDAELAARMEGMAHD